MRITTSVIKSILCSSLLLSTTVLAQVNANTPWQSVTTADGSTATPRHEASAVTVDGKIYLMGGRGQRPVEVFDPQTNRWEDLGSAPLEINHYQPVVIGQRIYAVASFTGGFPNEDNIPDIHVFDTVTEQWSIDGQMPASRLRGAAGAVIWQGDIYVLGGNTNGHNGGAVAWFDRYDPDTGTWTELEDAPHARDHFVAAIVDGQLVAAGGRATALPDVFANTVAPTNVYDFATGTWRTGRDIPTPRAGTFSAGAGDEIIVAGGERSGPTDAFDEVEAYNVNTNQWRALQPLGTARHSGGSAVVGSTWHVISGNTIRGGGAETSAHETLDLNVDQDSDNDGLTDFEETLEHNTNPVVSDTDDDGAFDGDEVDAGSDPLNPDTDSDGLVDGVEMNTLSTDPLLPDTDSDSLTDGFEVSAGSDPLSADTDGDNLADGQEAALGTSATNPDTDSDTLSDGDEVANGTNPLNEDTDNDGLMDANDPAPLTPLTTSPEPVDPGTDNGDNSDNSGNTDQTEIMSSPVRIGGGAMFWMLTILIFNIGLIHRRETST